MSYTSFDLPKTMTAGSMNTAFTYDANHRRVSKDYAITGILGTDHWVTSYIGVCTKGARTLRNRSRT